MTNNIKYKEGQKGTATLPDGKQFRFEIIEVLSDDNMAFYILQILDGEKAEKYSYIETFILENDPTIEMDEK